MKLSATPFHQTTGELLPVYRDAYLRGDLSSTNTARVDAYLRAHADQADEVLRRFYELKAGAHPVQPVGWVQQQLYLLRTEPQRFYRRAAGLVVVGALLAGAVLAGTGRPAALPAVPEAAAPVATVDATATRTVLVRGRILDENGRPLVGATVWQKGTSNGVSTDAEGRYQVRVAAQQPATLQYGYAGYAEEELPVRGGAVENVTLLPRTDALGARKKHWFFF